MPESYSTFRADSRIKAWHKLVKPQLHRTREINVLLFSHDVPHPLEAYTNLLKTLRPLPDMPNLQKLVIALGEKFYRDVSTYSRKLAQSFPRHLSSLRSLDLHRCALDWERTEISNLICLKIKYAPTEQRMSTSRLLRLLASSPRIETLVLLDALQDWSDQDPSQQALEPLTDQLNHVTLVDVSAPLCQALLVVDSIAPPPMSSITVRLPNPLMASEDDHIKLGACLQRFVDRSSHGIISMKIVGPTQHRISFTLGQRVGEAYESVHGFTLNLPIHFLGTDVIGEARKFLKYVSLASLQHLVLSLDQTTYQFSDGYWKQLFLLTPNLKTLAIWEMESARHILTLLTQPVNDNLGATPSSSLQDQDHAHYLLPQLHEVILGDKYSSFACDNPKKCENESRLFPRTLELFVRARAAVKVVKTQGQNGKDISLADDVVMDYIETSRPFDRLKLFLKHYSDIDTDDERFQRIKKLVVVEVNVASVVKYTVFST